MTNLEALHAMWSSEVKTTKRWLMPIIEAGSVMEKFMALRKLKTTAP
jgi:hypothetical protein